MNFPHFSDKHKFPGVLKAEDMISSRGKNGKEELHGATAAILCFQSSLMKYLSVKFHGKKTSAFWGKVVVLKKTDNRIAAAQTFGLGAPAVAVMLEELAASGVERCIAIGVAGTLQDFITTGELIIPTTAIRDEGTSYHYHSADMRASPSEELSRRLISALDHRNEQYVSGPVWTTDAPYRETTREITYYQHEGLLAVDMETSAFFCACSAMKIRAACALVAADSLAGGVWHHHNDHRKIESSLRRLANIAVETLST